MKNCKVGGRQPKPSAVDTVDQEWTKKPRKKSKYPFLAGAGVVGA